MLSGALQAAEQVCWCSLINGLGMRCRVDAALLPPPPQLQSRSPTWAKRSSPTASSAKTRLDRVERSLSMLVGGWVGGLAVVCSRIQY